MASFFVRPLLLFCRQNGFHFYVSNIMSGRCALLSSLLSHALYALFAIAILQHTGGDSDKPYHMHSVAFFDGGFQVMMRNNRIPDEGTTRRR